MAEVYEELWAALKAENPTAILVSGYRPGAITATGSVSYHSRKMAIDIGGPMMMSYFEWIVSKYPNSKEVIYSPAGPRQIHNGAPHTYGEPTKSDHYDHVHWAATSLSEASTGGTSVQTNDPLIPDNIESLASFIDAISKPDIWVRVGLFVGGAVLVFITFLAISKKAA
jgi:hypothetical protein